MGKITKIRCVTVAMLLGTLLIALPNLSFAGRDLLNELGNKVDRLDANKAFLKKKVLVMVGQEKKTTTIEKYFATVQRVLSESQYNLFTLPVAVSSLQQMPVAKITVSGTLITNLSVGKSLPSGLEGVADLYLLYDGDSALPLQVMANLETESK